MYTIATMSAEIEDLLANITDTWPIVTAIGIAIVSFTMAIFVIKKMLGQSSIDYLREDDDESHRNHLM